MPTVAPRTLAEQLRGWSDEALTALLQQRPDLAQPAPRDSAQLASRAGTRASVVRAVDGLTMLELTVLDAVSVLGETAERATVRRVVNAAAASTDTALDTLLARALVWGTDDRLRGVSVVGEVLGGSVSGLGPSVSRLLGGYGPDRVRTLTRDLGLTPSGDRATDVAAVAELLADPTEAATLVEASGPRTRELLDQLLHTGGTGSVPDADRSVSLGSASTPVEAALCRGLVVATDRRHVTLPREVAIALRGGHTTAAPVDVPPTVATTPRAASRVDQAAAGAAYELVRFVEVLLDQWGTAPPPVLRAGGLGVRDLKAAARLLGTGETRAAFLVELAAAAGLLGEGVTPTADAAWMPTPAYDLWTGDSTAERWATLVAGWITQDRLTPEADPGLPNTLAEGWSRAWLVDTRRAVLTELAALPEDEVLAPGAGVTSLVDRLRWLRPRRPAARTAAVAALVEEAEALGVAALGGLSAAGRALACGDVGKATVALDALLPPPVDHVLLQADLTAVAPGPLEAELAQHLAAVAEVESRGGATVYRFTESSVRRAFDAGWSAAEVHHFLQQSSRTPVPQALSYLVDDVSRRFGTLRVGHAASFVRSDDEPALAALVHDPRAASLRLRLLAPTVVVSETPLDVLLPRLRERGLAPVVESADGTVRLTRREAHRASAPRRRRVGVGSRQQARAQAQVRATVTAVRAGDRAAQHRPLADEPSRSPGDVVASLREAAQSGTSTWIEYVDNGGRTVELVVVPLRVESGSLMAYDERTEDTRGFALHRVRSVRPL